MIGNLRSLGLTIKEIEQLAGLYLDRPDEPIGPHLSVLLGRAERRIDERIGELEEMRRRIRAVRSEHAAVLAGGDDAVLTGDDPHQAAGTA